MPIWAAPIVVLFGAIPAAALTPVVAGMIPMREPGEIIVENDRDHACVRLFGGRTFEQARIKSVRAVLALRNSEDDCSVLHVHVLIETSGAERWESAYFTRGSPTWRLAHTLACHLDVPFTGFKIRARTDDAEKALFPTHEQMYRWTGVRGNV